MADQLPFPDTRDEPGTPRWVKVFGIIALVVVLLFVVLKLSGVGGEHGPSRHTPPFGITAEQSPSADLSGQ